MNCQETKTLLHGYVDGELDLMKSLEYEQHVQECSACAQALEALQAMRATIKGQALYFEPPSHLQARIQATVRRAGQVGPPARPLRRRWLALAASLLFVGLAGWGLVRFLPRPSAPARLTEELVASHVRSQMLPGHRVDVESSDQHTVKPWFQHQGKLDFSPAVYDFAEQGFPLVGGRLDYVDHRPVAALVYQRRQHLINLYVWPAPPGTETAPEMQTRQGYRLLHWTQSGMTYWAVSDLNETELKEFAGLVR